MRSTLVLRHCGMHTRIKHSLAAHVLSRDRGVISALESQAAQCSCAVLQRHACGGPALFSSQSLRFVHVQEPCAVRHAASYPRGVLPAARKPDPKPNPDPKPQSYSQGVALKCGGHWKAPTPSPQPLS